MPAPRGFTRSFAGGEVTPEFLGRIDDVRYPTGLTTCRNFVIKPHGPAENRAGTKLVREVKTSAKKTRLIPFVFASDQTVVIELGEGYFRFHTNGATVLSAGVPYEVSNSYVESELFEITFVQSNDIITFCHPNHPVSELARSGATSWTFTELTFTPALSAPTGVSATAKPATTDPGTPSTQQYTVTAVKGAEESEAASNGLLAGVSISTITKANPGTLTFFGATITGSSFSVSDRVYISGVGGMTQINNSYFKVRSYSYTPPSGFTPGFGTMTLFDDATGAVPVDTSAFATYTGGGIIQKEGGATCSNNLFDDGAYNTIVWSTVTGAERYYVYKLTNGLFGYIGQTEGLTFTDDNIAADISKTPPIADTPISSAGEYPACVGYFEQRRCFGGSTNKPANFWATKSGTESNLTYSIPQRDDDSIRFKIAARERNQIRHVVPMANLVLLTESAEWRVSAAEGEVLTPNVSLRPQSFIGSARTQPIIVNNNLIFAAARGGHLRELAYNWQANGYITGDISIRAPHLFDNKTVVDIAYSKAPIPIIWCVSSSGNLLGFTYVPEQEVGAWHRHDTTNGAFESVAVVAEGDEDAIYVVVRRTIGGATKRFVERMQTRVVGDIKNSFFVDCGLTYSGSPANVISGLGHLEGQTVAILADGKVQSQQVVTSGQVTLDEAASIVHVGLPITAQLETLPLAFEVQGYGQGRPKNINAVWTRVYQSRGWSVGPDTSRVTAPPARTDETYDAPPSLRTEEVRTLITPSWDAEGTFVVQQDQPLPVTVLSLAYEFAVGG